jgi:hypothetical protein
MNLIILLQPFVIEWKTIEILYFYTKLLLTINARKTT